ncbi:MAG: enoyl-ACP reductase FabV [Clostridiales bacterium]
MIIKPKARGFICTTAHPEGCYANVKEQIDYLSKKEKINGPKKVLIIGSSTGYGMSSRISTAFSSDASTIGVFFEKPSNGRSTASPGWYNTAAFEKLAHEQNLYAKSINGDAFSDQIKNETIDLIKKDLGKIDLLIYSLAAPRKTNYKTGEKYNSVLKPIGNVYSNKAVDFNTKVVSEVTVEPATEKEISDTVEVMGGNDWKLWIEKLKAADVLSEKFVTLAYSYIGSDITYPLYTKGTIGRAKDHLLETVPKIDQIIKDLDGKSYISVNKALITQASSAIPVIPLYISILYKIMKDKNTHEGCIEQCYRLFKDKLYKENVCVDELGRIRLDDWELEEDVQTKVRELWEKATTENIKTLTDINGYSSEFFKLFGFGLNNIDYEKDIDPIVDIPSIK